MAWRWRGLAGVMLCAGAMASAPPPASAPQSPSSTGASQTTPQGAPDDDFIEFLGADDVGDAAWWEFLKKAPPRGENPPATPPQDAKQ
jgi:hypothetical protein